MTETIQLGTISISVVRKDIKHVHLSVHPPSGRVTMVTPLVTRSEVARAYAVTKLGWIRAQQAKICGQAREVQRQFISRESHYLWGRRYLLTVTKADSKPYVRLSHRRITLAVRPGSGREKREAVLNAWHRLLLHDVLPALILRWEPKLGVKVTGYFLQRMKTRWGSCNHRTGYIRVNTELAKKPKDLLEYVVVHEMVHLLEPTHSERFMSILDNYYPSWREARGELNELPLTAEAWNP